MPDSSPTPGNSSLTGAERKFVSPELPAGQEFTYRFRAEYERDGETVSVTKKVPVRAGGTVDDRVRRPDREGRARAERRRRTPAR